MAVLKVAVDGSSYNESAADGLNRYVGEILKGFLSRSSNFRVYTAATELARLYSQQVTAINSRSIYKNIYRNNLQGNLSRLLWHQTTLPRRLKRDNISLFYSPVPEGMLYPYCPQVITIHDLLPIRFPETYPRVKYYFRYILPKLIAASQAIIAVSEYTKQEIETYFVNCDRPIYVVPQGYRSDIFKQLPAEVGDSVCQKYRLDRFILCVGETRSYKNIRRLIEAFSKVQLSGVELAIVGQLNKLDKALLDFPQQLRIGDRVKFLGYVSDADLAALYNAAKAFIFPSLYEGFGIPPLEAMACGCPVVASRVASIPEVCGCAAYYIDPESVDSLADGIYQVLNNKKIENYLKNEGLERAQKFRSQNHDMVDTIVEILLGLSL
jgi:glycosyltransferase involved in cell wall biosynthesis